VVGRESVVLEAIISVVRWVVAGYGEVISDGEVLAIKRSGREGEGMLLGGDGGER
jgi:hypothetical protein